jgi:hypothetical protein
LSRPDQFVHSELLFGLHKFPVDADGHIGIDAAKENLRGVDRVVPVKFENHLEFRLRWRVIEGRHENSSPLFDPFRNNVHVHDSPSGMIAGPRQSFTQVDVCTDLSLSNVETTVWSFTAFAPLRAILLALAAAVVGGHLWL